MPRCSDGERRTAGAASQDRRIRDESTPRHGRRPWSYSRAMGARRSLGAVAVGVGVVTLLLALVFWMMPVNINMGDFDTSCGSALLPAKVRPNSDRCDHQFERWRGRAEAAGVVGAIVIGVGLVLLIPKRRTAPQATTSVGSTENPD